MGSLTKNNIIKVLAASDHPLVRKGIISMLANEADIKVVGLASSIIEILISIYSNQPDLLIIDSINGAQSTNHEALKIINKANPNIKVLSIIDQHNERKELIALRMGVRGIICECADRSEFVNSIRSLYEGKLWIRRKILENFVVDILPDLEFNEEPQQTHFMNLLTKRELDIVDLVARGHKNKEIGNELFVTEKTVKNHLSSIFKKLNVKKRVELKEYLLHSSPLVN